MPTAVKMAVATVAGGAIGAVAGHVMRDFKISPTTTAAVVTGVGLVGIAATSGTSRWVAAGMATSGASQGATVFSEKYLKRQGLPVSMIDVLPVAPRNLPWPRAGGGIVEAFEEAERELAAAPVEVIPY